MRKDRGASKSHNYHPTAIIITQSPLLPSKQNVGKEVKAKLHAGNKEAINN
jgi:hypothetical protein